MTELHFQPATVLARLIREREIGARELLDHFLSRIERYNPDLNAIVWMDVDGARQRADAADAALARGDAVGPLHGVPMTIKESYNVAGSPTTWGDPVFADNVTAASALSVRRLQRAGVVLFGKTNVPLMLADWQSYNAIHGTCNNPWDLARTPGGSSGGSAAALAAGLTGIEAGSDIGASIRNPAHYCGVFGLKPTWGVIAPQGQSLPGVHAYSDISVIGPLARGADDLELALDAMAGPDELDGIAWKLDLPACGAKSLREMRVAVKLRDPCSEVDGAYADRLQTLVDDLARAGVAVREVEPSVDTRRLNEIYVLLLRAATSARTPVEDIERWRAALERTDAARVPYLDYMVRGCTMSHRDWLALNNERHGLRRAFQAFFEDWDILLCPAAASAAWPHDQSGERWQRTIEVNGHPVPTTDQLFWAGYSGVVYLPSTVGPAGMTAQGLPVGYQAIAGTGRDRTAIAFSRYVEREIGGFVPPPGYA
ncbi:MAG: amidase [Gammaproteobacteria bacterium]|nr:amidase [Gammaproteobacteria bacterium]